MLLSHACSSESQSTWCDQVSSNKVEGSLCPQNHIYLQRERGYLLYSQLKHNKAANSSFNFVLILSRHRRAGFEQFYVAKLLSVQIPIQSYFKVYAFWMLKHVIKKK